MRTLWHDIRELLKWLGGFVTVISLVVGVKTVHDYYQQWQQKQDAVNELVSAAEWLVNTENYSQAWAMYLEANELSPGSTLIRKQQYEMTVAWIDDFSVEKNLANDILNRLTAVLYRSLPHASDDEAATVLAHVARIQALRRYYNLSVFVDDEKLFAQALELSPENVYANTFLAGLLLTSRPVTVEAVERAQRLYDIALTSDARHAWVRSRQTMRLADLARKSSDVGDAAMRAYLLAAHEMLRNGEPAPKADLRAQVLDSYGFMGSGGRVEELIDIIPPDDHLAVYAWLQKGLDFRGDYSTQQDYVVARLREASGDMDGALVLYKSLLESDHTDKRLDALVDRAIERLTGEKSPRVVPRTYENDPVDTRNPWAFHLDTLKNINVKIHSKNFDQAIDYFYEAVDESDERLSMLMSVIPGILKRIKTVILRGGKLEQSSSYYSPGHFDPARKNWIDIMLFYGSALRHNNQLDSAIATFNDTLTFSEPLGEPFNRRAVTSIYELALTYARRAAINQDSTDRQSAMDNLKEAIDRGVVRNGLVGWKEVKGEGFAVLANESEYLELIRGR